MPAETSSPAAEADATTPPPRWRVPGWLARRPSWRPAQVLAWRPAVSWFWVGLAAAALIALALRLYGLNWDANNHLHPDEREIVFVAMCLGLPGAAGLRPGNCPPATTGPGWFFSPDSPLNPHFFAYGSLPLYLLALVCHGLAWLTHLTGGRFVPTDGGAWDDFNHFTLVGRALSALFDTGSVIVVGLLGRRLAGWRVGLLAAALVAVIPFEVQVSHFYAVDTVLTFFVLLTLLACLWLAQGPRERMAAAPQDRASAVGGVDAGDEADTWQPARLPWHAWRAGLVVGACCGLALASQVSALPLLLRIGLALVLRARRRGLDEGLLGLLGIGAAAILVFAVTSPYALIDWQSFMTQVHEQTALSQGQFDYPYVRQFANTAPYLYEIEQLLRFDMGPLLGTLGLAGAVWAGWRVWRRWDSDWLVIVGWIVIYFAIIGSAYTKFSRYMLPLFPVFALCGAALLGALAVAGARRLARWQAEPREPTPGRLVGRVLARPRAALDGLTARFGVRWWHIAVAALGVVVLLASGFLALALDNIYSAPNTRVQASVWLYDHVAPGATVTSEVWDDGLPILVPAARPGPGYGLTRAGHVIDPGEYNNLALDLYAEDTPQKAAQLAQQLASANVIVLSSQRLVGSIPKLPDRYPMTTRYYQLLFAGKLGFHLAAQFQNPPHLLGLTASDAGADESFSVYDHPPVWIFVRDGTPKTADQLLAQLTQGVTLPATSQRSGAQKSLLLSPADIAANNQMPALGLQFPLDSLSNRFPLLIWLVVVELLGLLSFPLAYFAFPGLRDRGWGLSKLLGLLVLGFAIWLPASLHLFPFTSGTTFAAFALFAVVSMALVWWRRAELWDFLRARWRLLALCEGAFLAAFAFFTWIRALDPDLWHIYRGGEKPMELAYLNGILHSQFFPPADPWFSGGAINYYYYGQYLIALLIRLTGVTPTTAFNLAIPLLFALCFTAAFSIGVGLTRRWWAGLVGGGALVVVGNLDGLWQAIGQWRVVLAHGTPPPFDYWASSRVIPFTINEFPYWSFLYADLHPHLIDLAVVVLIIASCASLLVAAKAPLRVTLPAFAALTLALGAAGAINTWDLPAMAVLVVATLILRELRIASGGSWRAVRARLRWPVLRRLGAQIILIVGGAYALYLPFYAHFQNFTSGIGTVTTPTDPNQFFMLFGIWLFLLASFFVVELRDRLEARALRLDPTSAVFAPARLWIVALAALLVLSLAYLAGVKVLLLVLLVGGLALALNPRHSPLKLLTYALLLLGLAVALGVELIYVRDFLDGGSYERMNTVFKFYYQVWVCFALGGALAFAQLAPRALGAMRWLGGVAAADTADTADTKPATVAPAPVVADPSDPFQLYAGVRYARAALAGPILRAALRGLWVIAFVALLSGSLVFLVEGTAARLNDPAVWAALQPPPGGVQPQGLSLDGMAYMRGWFPYDYAAIQWMNTHISGMPTIMVAATGPYAVHVSDYTGLPSVLVTGHEYEQRYASEVTARQGDVSTFFTTGDPQLALGILHQYGVRYLYIGPTERTCISTDGNGNCVPAPPGAVQKYATLTQMGALKPVYQNAQVTIYEVVG